MSVVFLYSFFSWRRVFVGFSKQNLKSTPKTPDRRRADANTCTSTVHLDPLPRIPTRFTGTTIDTPAAHVFGSCGPDAFACRVPAY